MMSLRKHTMKRLNNTDCRMLGLKKIFGGLESQKRNAPIKLEIKNLNDYFNGE